LNAIRLFHHLSVIPSDFHAYSMGLFISPESKYRIGSDYSSQIPSDINQVPSVVPSEIYHQWIGFGFGLFFQSGIDKSMTST
jgi:hypothetical protein